MLLFPLLRVARCLATISETNLLILIPCEVIESLQFIWISGICRWNQRVSDLQMNWSGLRKVGVNQDIQFKICAEYRDMLPRPRLVYQEPGLRPMGRSPGVSDKSSGGLGSMSRYSAQILICFYSIHFSIPLWVWLGTLQNRHYVQSPVPLSIVIKMRLLIRLSNLPACHAEVQQDENTSW